MSIIENLRCNLCVEKLNSGVSQPFHKYPEEALILWPGHGKIQKHYSVLQKVMTEGCDFPYLRLKAGLAGPD